jgi:hypothetical protein
MVSNVREKVKICIEISTNIWPNEVQAFIEVPETLEFDTHYDPYDWDVLGREERDQVLKRRILENIHIWVDPVEG